MTDSPPVTTATLTAEYIVWCDANNLPQISADEHDVSELTPEQRAWVSDFSERWTRVQRAEDESELGPIHAPAEAGPDLPPLVTATAEYLAGLERNASHEWSEAERLGARMFHSSVALHILPKAFNQAPGHMADIARRVEDAQRGWWTAHRRCYAEGVKDCIVDRDGRYPQFSAAWEAWGDGWNDEAAELVAPSGKERDCYCGATWLEGEGPSHMTGCPESEAARATMTTQAVIDVVQRAGAPFKGQKLTAAVIAEMRHVIGRAIVEAFPLATPELRLMPNADGTITVTFPGMDA